jgi:N-acetylmuramoyl-L-alanine amidase
MLLQQNIKISPKKYILLRMAFLCLLLSMSSSIFSQNSKFTIVLDAGHGGKDPGTLGLSTFKNEYESNVALNVVLQVGKLLEKHKDIKTVYTRKKKKVFIQLRNRGKIANKAKADLFISVHCNYSPNKKYYGATTYVLGLGKTAKNLELSKRENNVILMEDDYEKHYNYNSNSKEFITGLRLIQENYLDKSIEFASITQSQLAKAKRRNLGIHQGNLAVLYDTYMPSVLIEIGFLSNVKEEKYLHTTAGVNTIASAIYKAIKTYKNRIKSNSIEQSSQTETATYKTNSTTKTNQSTPTTSSSNKLKYYRVQISTSRKKINTKSVNFHRLKGVKRIKINNRYKYYYGDTQQIDEAKKLRLEAIKKGYTDAFISKYYKEKSILSNTQKTVIATTDTKPKISSNTSNTQIYKGIDFKVQISSSRFKTETKSYNFHGLKNIERVKIDKHYKYYYGKTNDFNLIKKMRIEALDKGFVGAFIVAIKNGRRVSVTKVLKGLE